MKTVIIEVLTMEKDSGKRRRGRRDRGRDSGAVRGRALKTLHIIYFTQCILS